MGIAVHTCPYCQCPIQLDDKQLLCSICHIPHHEECWKENGYHCTTFGCMGATGVGEQAGLNQQAIEQEHIIGNAIQCRICGTINDEGSNYCRTCGGRCTSCGSINQLNSSFCRNCGNRIAGYYNPISANNSAGYGGYQVNQVRVPAVAAQAILQQYPKASIMRRFIALILDFAFSILPYWSIGSVLQLKHAPILSLIAICWAIWYALTKDGFVGGHSYGKSMCGLMVVNLDNKKPCTKRQSALRMSTIVFLMLDSIGAFTDEAGRRLGDELANTQVIASKNFLSKVE